MASLGRFNVDLTGRLSTRRRLMFQRSLGYIFNKMQRYGWTPEEIVAVVKDMLGLKEPEKPEPEPGPLVVEGVDLKVALNTEAHHTAEYDLVEEGDDPPLVVRRGQPFSVHVQLSRPFSDKTHELRLLFEIGDSATESKKTRALLKLSEKNEAGKWGVKLVKQEAKTLELNVFTPSDCVVGKWNFTVRLLKKGETKPVSSHRQKKPVYILFNPWCKEDVVYLEDKEAMAEYVMDESGCIFTGSLWWSEARPWLFGQFTGDVLDCSIYLLDSSDLKMEVRGDPIKVVRKLSAMVNAIDDSGVLVGNWSGDYGGGASPSDWTGSVKILEQYYTNKSPVKYGQCWVFSGVLTTVCRALGIPCRSVTNFSSAHDTDCSVTIDMHFGVDGSSMSNDDSVWNFHVWNEVWMRRDDLPDGYGGWQACDATPQEASEGQHQCGPCPLRAIKQGEISLTNAYDAPFIFAEVNADRIKWKWSEEEDRFLSIGCDPKVVGKNMSTRALKSVRDNSKEEREVVTHLYKYDEGTAEERAAVLKAYHSAEKADKKGLAYDLGPKDVEFKLNFNGSTPVGEDFVMKLDCSNNSTNFRTVDCNGIIKTMFYTGIPADTVKKETTELRLKPGTCESFEVKVTAEEYRQQLKDGCFLSLTAGGLVRETNQSTILVDTVMLGKPRLSIKGPSKGRVGDQFDVTVSFSNPLPSRLTDCNLHVEGPGITKPKTYPQGDVAPNGTFLTTLELKPKKKGSRRIVFVFSAKELDNITGHHEMEVKKA